MASDRTIRYRSRIRPLYAHLVCIELGFLRNVVLLVVIVPKLVPLAYVSTTLGMHKSVSFLACNMSIY